MLSPSLFTPQAWQDAPWSSGAAEDDAGFMLFDTVLAFDHVKHRILVIANARITADEDLQALYQFACAKIQFLERELERSLSQSNGSAHEAPSIRSNQPREQFETGLRATIEWYLGHMDWVETVRSGGYRTWIDTNYLARGKA